MVEHLVSEVETYLASAPKTFKFKDVVAAVTKGIKFGHGEKQRTESDILNLLVDDPLVFCDPETGDCRLRRDFFRDGQLLVTPSAWEIGEGILLPGHRFVPFCFTEIFPSEVVLRNGKTPLKTREVILRLEEVADYYSLLGAESMYDFLVAEHQQNAARLRSGVKNGEAPAILTAFELQDYYREHRVEYGDVLVFAIRDWDKGEFELTGILTAEQRSEKTEQSWLEKLDDTLAKVIEKYDFYLQIPEQFSRAFFLAGEEWMRQPALSLDEYIRRSERIEVGYMSGDTALVVKDETPEENYVWEPPDGVTVSKGNTGSLEEIIKECGCMLQMPEIEAFMLDQFYRQLDDFDTFYQRCIGPEKLNFADEAQQAFFMNYLEDWWENRMSTYDRFSDDAKAPIRARLLELIEERRDWLIALHDLDIDLEKLQEEELFHRLAEASVHLVSLCRLLNSEQNFVSTSEADALGDKLEQMAEIQAGCIDKLNTLAAKMSGN